MTIFVTADHHFGHANIIKFCDRPFDNVEAMDEFMENAWNRTVKPEDIVFHLGDFSFRRDPSNWGGLLKRLNGTKCLIRGNHDPKQIKTSLDGWSAVYEYFELHENGLKIVMSHYAMEDWNGEMYGSTMLHGHSHNRARVIPGRLDVGVDSVGYEPLTLDEAIAKAQKRKSISDQVGETEPSDGL